MPPSTTLHYDAPWPVFALDWCKTPGLGSQRIRSGFRLALGSFTEDYRNRISIVGLADERSLHDPSGYEDETYGEGYTQSPDFVVLAEAMHGYPITKVGWEPASTISQGWKGSSSELLTSTGDALRIWEYFADPNSDIKPNTFVGRTSQPPTGRLTQKIALSSSKNPNPTSAPLTSFSWNTIAPALVVTSSIDTTCTVWDISASSAVTQLIAHDREVFDVAWVPGSTDSFVSVGADGSLRAFDLRSLEHSTILYEAHAYRNQTSSSSSSSAGRQSTPLLRISFNPLDPNSIATFHTDSADIQILDMRNPGRPVLELKGHKAPIQAIGWGSAEGSVLASAGDDSQLLIWDLVNSHISPRQPVRSPGISSSPRPDGVVRSISDPILSYSSNGEINNLAWSPPMGAMTLGGGMSTAAGEWIAVASGRSVKALKV